MAKRHEDWQVNQADAALRLYQYFLSRNQRASVLQPADTHNDWTGLQERMRTALRLRQRSYSTEKTYLTWFRDFRSFVKGKNPAELGGRNLQDYLSHLAVEKKISPSTQNQALNAT